MWILWRIGSRSRTIWIQSECEVKRANGRIPREEVEEIAACVMEHLSAFVPGCQHTICGGYEAVTMSYDELISVIEGASLCQMM
jgi:hypothetical protein